MLYGNLVLSRREVLGLMMGAIALAGCQRRQLPPKQEPLYRLPHLKQARHQPLVQQYRRLLKQRMLLWHLGDPPASPDENAALILRNLFGPDDAQSLAQALASFFPPERLWNDPLRQEQVRSIVDKHQEALAQVHRALELPLAVFPIDYAKGLEADLRFLYQVQAALRLEVLAGLKAAWQDNLDEATQHMVHALHLARALQGHRHPVVRIQAALLRNEALQGLQSLLVRHRLSTAQLGQVLGELHRAQAALPEDHHAWIVDRALGLHFYEYLYAQRWEDVITGEDRQRLGNELAHKLRFAPRHMLEKDEAYYLEEMEDLIALAQRPYWKRRDFLSHLERRLRVKTPEHPAACVLLLPDVLLGMKQQALDRARLAAWTLALERALGQQGPVPLSELTGKSYRVSQGKDRVVVWGTGALPGEPEVPVLVPRPETP